MSSQREASLLLQWYLFVRQEDQRFLMTVTSYVVKLLILTLVQTHFSFQEGIFKLNNITEEKKAYNLQSGKCCGAKKVGNINQCSFPCELVFFVCLFKFGDSRRLCLIRIDSQQVVTSLKKNMDLKFSQIYGEPLSVKLTARDLNSLQDDNVVFETVFNSPITFIDKHWNPVSSTLTRGLLSFSYRIKCRKNLYGKTCNILCIPTTGYYTCSETGERVCLSGWHGDYCDRRCDCDIARGTSHGTCRKDGTCQCDFGWSGTYCDRDLGLCVTRPCQNGGTCDTNTGVCKCPPPLSGKYCEKGLPSPSSSVPSLAVTSSISYTNTLKILPSSIWHTKTSSTILFTNTVKSPKSSISCTNTIHSSYKVLDSLLTESRLVSSTTTLIASGMKESTSVAEVLTSKTVLPATTAGATSSLSSSSTLPVPSSSRLSPLSSSSPPPLISSRVSSSIPPSSRVMSTEEIQPTSIHTMNVSKLISSTVWVTITHPTEMTTPPPKSGLATGIIIAVISVTVGAVLFIAGTLSWYLWRRKRQHRRKSQVSTIVPMTLSTDADTSSSRPSTFSSSRSISPLLNYLYERDSILELEPPDIEVIGVLNQPVVQQDGAEDIGNVNEGADSKRYTLQEMNKLCMEAIQGTKLPKQKHKNSSSSTRAHVKVSKTFSNGSSKSQQSSNYSSSGYGSGSSSPTLNLSARAISSAAKKQRLEHFLVQQPVGNQPKQKTENNNDTRSPSGRSRDHQNNIEETDLDEDGVYNHKIVIHNHVHFEGLPNFIVYKEDTSV